MKWTLALNICGFFIGTITLITPLWPIGIILVPLSAILIIDERFY